VNWIEIILPMKRLLINRRRILKWDYGDKQGLHFAFGDIE
jgi:hypothetical protein